MSPSALTRWSTALVWLLIALAQPTAALHFSERVEYSRDQASTRAAAAASAARAGTTTAETITAAGSARAVQPWGAQFRRTDGIVDGERLPSNGGSPARWRTRVGSRLAADIASGLTDPELTTQPPKNSSDVAKQAATEFQKKRTAAPPTDTFAYGAQHTTFRAQPVSKGFWELVCLRWEDAQKGIMSDTTKDKPSEASTGSPAATKAAELLAMVTRVDPLSRAFWSSICAAGDGAAEEVLKQGPSSHVTGTRW